MRQEELPYIKVLVLSTIFLKEAAVFGLCVLLRGEEDVDKEEGIDWEMMGSV
ncbi:phosphatidylinositol 4-kinase gamma 5-like [Sesbania bispinosa]|nr:phosphatidylinositol 4-kinase gamma 5-like [Sesbania bispinosa]